MFPPEVVGCLLTKAEVRSGSKTEMARRKRHVGSFLKSGYRRPNTTRATRAMLIRLRESFGGTGTKTVAAFVETGADDKAVRSWRFGPNASRTALVSKAYRQSISAGLDARMKSAQN